MRLIPQDIKKRHPKWMSFLRYTSQEGFEPPTDGLEGRCSIQLSYWDMLCIYFHVRYLLYRKMTKCQSLFLGIILRQAG